MNYLFLINKLKQIKFPNKRDLKHAKNETNQKLVLQKIRSFLIKIVF